MGTGLDVILVYTGNMPLYTVFAFSDFSDSHGSAFTWLTVGPPAREVAQGWHGVGRAAPLSGKVRNHVGGVGS